MKNIITCRPMAFACTAFLLSLLLFMNISSKVLLIVGIAVLVLSATVVVFSVLKKRRFLPALSILLAISISAAVSYLYNGIYYKNKVAVFEGTHLCEFTVTDNVKYEPYYTVSHVTITSIEGEDCDVRAVLVSSFMSVFGEGYAYSAELELTPTKQDFAFGDTYDFSKGFAMSAYCEDTSKITYIGKETDLPHTAISKIQKQISVFFDMYLEDAEASLCKALLDGDKTDLPISAKQSFSQLGISHMLAISGMHLSVIIGIFAVFTDKIRLHKRGGFLVLSLITLIYVFLTGFSPSVVRAALMLIMTYAAFWLGRRSDAVNALLLSVSLICLLSVGSVFDIGLWLSFTATLGILLVGAPLAKSFLKEKRGIFIKILKWIVSVVLVTISATMFTFPVILLYFKEMSIVTLLSNLVFTLPLTLILFLIVLMVIASPLSFLTRAVADVLGALCKAFLWIASKTASPAYLFSLDFTFLYYVCALAAVLCAVLLIKRKRASTIPVFATVMALVVIANAVAFNSVSDERGIGYYSRGNNDALYVKSGANVLIIDNSNGGYSFINEAVEMSKAKNFSRVTLMLTHYHIYLAYGVSHLAEYGVIDAVILPTPLENEINAYEAVLRSAEHFSLDIIHYAPNKEAVEYNGAKISVCSGKPNGSNHNAAAVFADIDGEVFAYYGNKSADIVSFEAENVVKRINGVHSSRVEDQDARIHFYNRVSPKN